MRIQEKTTEHLESVNIEIEVSASFKITSDAIYLSNYIDGYFKKTKDKKKFLEIGAGNGIISLLISKNENIENITAVELQKNVYEYLVANVSKNKLEGKISPLNDDIMNISGEFDYIFSNPPYYKLNSGKLPKNEIELVSKYEKALTLEKLILKVKELLKNEGEFCIIIPSNRLNDLQKYIYNKNMNILVLKFFVSSKKELVIVHGKKGGKNNSSIKIEIENV
ncbi:MAG: methyltransferase [Leptotrichiaceae bacterium]